MLLVLTIFIVGVSAPVIYAQPSGADGILHYSFSVGGISSIGESKFEPYITGEFTTLIEYAESLIGRTFVSKDGTDISVNEHWADEAAHEAFQIAIETARTELKLIRDMKVLEYFEPGDEFEMTLSISGNSGFASMMLQLTVPEGLELTRVNVVGFQDFVVLPINGHDEDTGMITPPVQGPGRLVVSCLNIGSDCDYDGELLVYTFRVLDNVSAGVTVTDPITVAFAGYTGYSLPMNADGVLLDILPPGNLMPSKNIGERRGELPRIVINSTNKI